MNKTEIKKVIVAQKESFRVNEYVTRDPVEQLQDCFNNPFIQIVTGVRRCGKSTMIQHLRENYHEKNYCINFDDNRLSSFTVNDFEKLNESFQELYDKERTYYFDEIQIIDGWERFVSRLYNEGNKVFITGSNATMLSQELGTYLTGRNIQSAMFPYSFSEYLRFKKIEFSTADFFSAEKSLTLKKAFRDYVVHGGFPEFLQTLNPFYLKNLFENILYKDVVARYNIRNVKTVAEILHYLISNISKLISYNAVKNIFNVSNADTIKEYIGYFENAFLLFSINKFDYSLKKQLINPKKIYTIDTGLVNSVSFQFSENYGRQLENIVFLQLKRMNFEIFYHSNKFECDFVVRVNDKIANAFQVTQSIENESTRTREMNGLTEAMQTYGLTTGLILTEDEEDEFITNDLTIKVKPVWKWLLNPSEQD